ncbi:hypothetical protein GGI07_001917 [Coemansia sp. Benny D115]|nr:hypothetical protein GGI07_001917 [Coemansia sp. Benny D115]
MVLADQALQSDNDDEAEASVNIDSNTAQGSNKADASEELEQVIGAMGKLNLSTAATSSADPQKSKDDKASTSEPSIPADTITEESTGHQNCSDSSDNEHSDLESIADFYAKMQVVEEVLEAFEAGKKPSEIFPIAIPNYRGHFKSSRSSHMPKDNRVRGMKKPDPDLHERVYTRSHMHLVMENGHIRGVLIDFSHAVDDSKRRDNSATMARAASMLNVLEQMSTLCRNNTSE